MVKTTKKVHHSKVLEYSNKEPSNKKPSKNEGFVIRIGYEPITIRHRQTALSSSNKKVSQ
jgi:hypothetical protein